MSSHANELESLRLPELQQRFFEVVGEQTRCPNRTFLIRRIEAALRQREEEAVADTVETETKAAAVEPPGQEADDEEVEVGESASAAEEPEELSSGDAEPKEEVSGDTAAEGEADVAEPIESAAPGTEAAPVRLPRGRFKDMTVEELRALYISTIGRPTVSVNKNYLIWKVRECEKGRIGVGPRETRTPAQQADTKIRVLPLRLDVRAVEAMDEAWRAQGMKSRMQLLRRALGHYLDYIGAHDAAGHFTSGGEQ